MKVTNIKSFVALIFATLVLGLCPSVSAQSKGSLDVKYSTSSLDSLFIYSNKSNYNQTTLDGFRIQIYSGSGVNSKQEASDAQARFSSLYPDEKIYIIYNAPFWRVRVGDYRSKSEALPLLGTIKANFAGSYIVKDNTVRKKSFRK